MKKFLLVALLAVVSVSAKAQFEKGTNYMNASLTGLDLSYANGTKFRFGLESMGGQFVQDEWLVFARFGYEHQYIKGPDNDVNNVNVGAGFRYYMKKNGIFMGAGLQYEHANVRKGNYIDITPEVGYCFYLSHYLSIEPSVYYNMCLNRFVDGSKFGVRLGFGYYY